MQNEQIYRLDNKECLSFVSIFYGSSDAFFLREIDGSLKDLRDDLSNPIGIFLTLIVGSFLGESDIDRAGAHQLDLAFLGLVSEEKFGLNRLFNVHER